MDRSELLKMSRSSSRLKGVKHGSCMKFLSTRDKMLIMHLNFLLKCFFSTNDKECPFNIFATCYLFLVLYVHRVCFEYLLMSSWSKPVGMYGHSTSNDWRLIWPSVWFFNSTQGSRATPYGARVYRAPYKRRWFEALAPYSLDATKDGITLPGIQITTQDVRYYAPAAWTCLNHCVPCTITFWSQRVPANNHSTRDSPRRTRR